MTRQPTRYELAAKLLAAPVLDTPLLDRLRQNPADVNRWADVPWEALSGGEQNVLGWLAVEVWPDLPLLVPDLPACRRPSLWQARWWCLHDDESRTVLEQVAHDLIDLPMGVAA